LEIVMGILWTLIIGFLAGVIAKVLHPGPNEPAGFIVTTLLGVAGAFVATYLGQAMGWYQPGEGAGLIGAVIGAIIVLVVWGMFAPRDVRRV
jgi:uncharacterized membrane protein YeaQ/YmgE (transglycosylase-associated protein family)